MQKRTLLSIALTLAMVGCTPTSDDGGSSAGGSGGGSNTGGTGGGSNTTGGTSGGGKGGSSNNGGNGGSTTTGGSGGSSTTGGTGGSSNGGSGGSNGGSSAGGTSGGGGSTTSPDAGGSADSSVDGGSSSGGPAAPLNDQVLAIPCPANNIGSKDECSFPAAMHKAEKTITLAGSPTVTYKIKLDVCAIFEGMTYSGCMGTADNAKVCIDGKRSNSGYDADYPTMALKVGDPARTYYLNMQPGFNDKIFKFAYMTTIEAKGGTTITLQTDGGGNDGHYKSTHVSPAITCPGMIPGVTQPFPGQFLHVNVVSTDPMQ